jgi:hypothetical protein
MSNRCLTGRLRAISDRCACCWQRKVGHQFFSFAEDTQGKKRATCMLGLEQRLCFCFFTRPATPGRTRLGIVPATNAHLDMPAHRLSLGHVSGRE